MVIEISAGSAETEAKAETVSPCVLSPARTVTMVTPAGKWRNAFRNSSDEITRVSSTSTIIVDMLSPLIVNVPAVCGGTYSWHLTCSFLLGAARSQVVDNRARRSSNPTGGHGPPGEP